MRAIAKEQTAFRFSPDLTAMIKFRAANLGKSVNAYVTDLITDDLERSHTLPKVEVPVSFDDEIERFAGKMTIPDERDLESDERLQRIWNL